MALSAIQAVNENIQKIHKQQTANTKNVAVSMREVVPGSMVIFKNESREDIARLINVKRTRFVAEYPDGRQVSVPCSFFLRVTEDVGETRITDVARRNRKLVRQLASKHFDQIRTQLLSIGVAALPDFLDELGAAYDRIKNAPKGFTKGIFGSALGIVKKVNPLDQALVKRIPKIIADIANKGANREKVLEAVRKHPHKFVRSHCLEAIGVL